MAGLIIDEEMDIGQGQFTRCMLCKQELFISASVYLRRDPHYLSRHLLTTQLTVVLSSLLLCSSNFSVSCHLVSIAGVREADTDASGDVSSNRPRRLN